MNRRLTLLILIVKNGPNWFPEASMRHRAEAFSRLGETEIWTFGNPARFQEGRASVVAMGTNPGTLSGANASPFVFCSVAHGFACAEW